VLIFLAKLLHVYDINTQHTSGIKLLAKPLWYFY